MMKLINRVSEDLVATKMDKAVAPFVPLTENYFDGADIIGDVLHQPLLQSKLSSYPPFLMLSERAEFKELAGQEFQSFWLGGPSVNELKANPKIEPLLGNVDLYTNIMGLVNGDLKDLKEYVETGKSAKYDEEKILGRWSFNYNQSMSVNRKKKPNMTLTEAKQIRAFLGTIFRNATLTAFLDSTVTLKLPSLPGERGATSGSWKNVGTGTYTLSIAEGDKSVDVDAVIDGNRLVFSRGPYSLVFER